MCEGTKMIGGGQAETGRSMEASARRVAAAAMAASSRARSTLGDIATARGLGDTPRCR